MELSLALTTEVTTFQQSKNIQQNLRTLTIPEYFSTWLHPSILIVDTNIVYHYGTHSCFYCLDWKHQSKEDYNMLEYLTLLRIFYSKHAKHKCERHH